MFKVALRLINVNAYKEINYVSFTSKMAPETLPIIIRVVFAVNISSILEINDVYLPAPRNCAGSHNFKGQFILVFTDGRVLQRQKRTYII